MIRFVYMLALTIIIVMGLNPEDIKNVVWIRCLFLISIGIILNPISKWLEKQ